MSIKKKPAVREITDEERICEYLAAHPKIARKIAQHAVCNLVIQYHEGKRVMPDTAEFGSAADYVENMASTIESTSLGTFIRGLQRRREKFGFIRGDVVYYRGWKGKRRSYIRGVVASIRPWETFLSIWRVKLTDGHEIIVSETDLHHTKPADK